MMQAWESAQLEEDGTVEDVMLRRLSREKPGYIVYGELTGESVEEATGTEN